MMELLQKLGLDTAGYDALVPGLTFPGWIYTVIFLATALVVARWAWRATRPLDSRAKRTSIAALRISALALLFLILFDPAIVLEKRMPIKPRVAVLWDMSRSMGLSSRPGGKTRLDTARKWWRDADSLRRRLDKNYRTEIWTFADIGAPAGPEAFSAGPPGEPEGDRTDILKALDRVAQSGGEPPAGVILVSDGADNAALAEAAERENGVEEALKNYPSPVFTVPLGETIKHKDLGIEKVDVPEYGFVRNAVEIRVSIESRGFGGVDLPVTILEGERVVAVKSVKLDSNESRVSVELAFTPDQVGDFLYKIDIPRYEGEAVYENNTYVFSLKVLRDKIRVLHVVGRPSWDVRFLREALIKDPTIELVSFYILRETTDAPMAASDELSLIPFPTDELFDTKIRTFDLIVFQNFSWIPYIRPSYLLNIRDFVMDFGGGFVMIGGPESFAGGRYARTAVEDILPVELVGEGSPFQGGEYRPRLTEAGSRHPITAMETSPGDTRRLWDSMPPVEGFNVVGKAKPGATVLLEHPFQGVGEGNMPVMAVWSAGRGKVMSLATDTAYRWRLDRMVAGGAGEEFLQMWRAAVRWLVGDPEGKRVRVRTDRSTYSPGGNIGVRIKALDLNYAPAPDAQIEAYLEGGGSPVQLSGFTVEGEEIAATLDNPGPGGWTIKVSANDGEGNFLGDDEAVFVVERLGREFSPPWPNYDLLDEIAKTTGGKVWSSKKDPDPDRMESPRLWRVVGRRRLALWDNWAMGGLLLLVLAAEWYARRRWGLN